MLRTHDDDAPVAREDETLVAYLDGELGESERQRLEEQLISDASLRLRLSELQSGWEMLDYLPPAHVTHDFARSTMEMVAASTSQELQIQRQRQPRRIFRWLLLIGLATLLMAAAGFATVQGLERMRFEAQLTDLPLAEHLDAYQLEVDLELMRQLADDPQWNEAMELAAQAGGLVVPEPLGIAEMELDERAEQIPQMDPETRRWLTGQWERLQLLGPEQLERVRQRAEAVRQQERPAEVLRTMKEYARWFESLPPETQERIVTAEDRLAAIRQEVQRSALGWVHNYGVTLGESDRELIYEALKWIARDRLEWADRREVWSDDRLRFLKELRAPSRDRSPAEGPALTAEEFLLGGMARSPWRTDRSRRRDSASPQPPTRRDPDNPFAVLFGPPTPEELEAVEEVLSNKALLILEAASGTPSERQSALWRWCVSIIRSKSPAGEGSQAMLNRYLAIDPAEREVLDLKPPDEIFDELGDRRRTRFRGNRP